MFISLSEEIIFIEDPVVPNGFSLRTFLDYVIIILLMCSVSTCIIVSDEGQCDGGGEV